MSASQAYPLLARVVAAAVNVSQKSARILRDVKKSGQLNIKEKDLNDYVTVADFQSQLNIIKSLEKQFSKIHFCGEEGVTIFTDTVFLITF
jgi:3'-phosphoadenosine 5'-phosphosulfate (PAPS) 3'-phosphatase